MGMPLSDHTWFSSFRKALLAFSILRFNFRIKRSIYRKSTAKVYKRINYIPFCTLDEDVRFNTELLWRWNKHDHGLLQTNDKSKSSAFSKEEIHNRLHIFFSVNNKICIVRIEALPNKSGKFFILCWNMSDQRLYLWFWSKCRHQRHSVGNCMRKLQQNIWKKKVGQECQLV